MKHLYFYFFVLLLCFWACKPSSNVEVEYGNPSAEGFNVQDSDPEAIAIADEVMEAMGGRKAWDNTKYIQWNFFNSRRHVWNKHTNDVVIEGIRDTFTIRMNMDKMEGTVNYHGNELTKADSLDKYLERGKSMWINDAYWLVMPYKLKDSGVTLKYLGKDTTQQGVMSDVLELTFESVGNTPDNKYKVYVDPDSRLVTQWDYYTKYSDSIPRFQIPWDNWKKHGDIMLSGDRGGNRQLTEVAVGDSLSMYFTQ